MGDKVKANGGSPGIKTSKENGSPGVALPEVPDEGYAFLTEEAVDDMASRAMETGSFSELIRTLGKIYSDYCALKQSFQLSPAPRTSLASDGSLPTELAGVKEALRAQTEEDKDVDSSESPQRRESQVSVSSEFDDILLEQTVDVEAVRRSYKKLFQLKDKDGSLPAVRPLTNTVPTLCQSIELDLRTGRVNPSEPGITLLVVLIIELPMLNIPDLANILPDLCSLVTKLPISAQAKLARTLAVVLRDSPSYLQQHVYTVQQLITARLLNGVFRMDYITNEDQVVCDATRFLRILLAVNLLAGYMEPRLNLPVMAATSGQGAQAAAAEQTGTNGEQDALLLMADLDLDESEETSEEDEMLPSGTSLRADDDGFATTGIAVPSTGEARPSTADSETSSATTNGTAARVEAKRRRGGAPVGAAAGATTGRSRSAYHNHTFSQTDPLMIELGINILDCRRPLIGLEEFYNELLSEQLNIEQDYTVYYEGSRTDQFSFLSFPFILTPSARTQALYLDNRTKMYNRRTFDFISALMQGNQVNPVLKLRVRRDHIVEDALVNLELVALDNPGNLKKQLVVEFEGEQGVDEGGVSKEFFQLIVEQLFNPDFGMFTLDQDTQSYWFNPTSFEADAQFTLIGIIIGLAIYNNVILDIRFPMVVYRKLFGARGTYRDLIDYGPPLARGLHQLLVYNEPDISDVFCQTFRVSYKDVFGVTLTHDLKPNGDNIVVDHSNKVEFVELYADFLLNRSVERQFNAFRRGFEMVTRDSPITRWFRPEEVELLVCGQRDFDLNALQESCEYDGYQPESEVICWFWDVVHDMSDDEKRLLLQFTTGSDRVPVGGLAKLRMVITRHGPDSDRLPSAHTCFNVLLLPEYSSKEKLRERLLKAIAYSKGFGLM